MRISELMTEKVLTIGPEAPIRGRREDPGRQRDLRAARL